MPAAWAHRADTVGPRRVRARQATLAVTPGQVVLKQPADRADPLQCHDGEDVRAEAPVLIFPPWINKYYVLDLTPAELAGGVAARSGLHGLHGLVAFGGR